MENLTKTNEFGKEVFTKEFTNCSPTTMIEKLFAFMLIKDVDTTELIIKNTFTKEDSEKIIKIINLLIG